MCQRIIRVLRRDTPWQALTEVHFPTVFFTIVSKGQDDREFQALSESIVTSSKTYFYTNN